MNNPLQRFFAELKNRCIFGSHFIIQLTYRFCERRFLSCIFPTAVWFFISCSNSGNPLPPEANDTDTSFIPNSVWVSEAENWIGISDRLDSAYFLYASLDGFDGRELRMLFGPRNMLYTAEILGDSAFDYTLYFENQKVIFSRLFNRSENEEKLVAYANEKPYAAAVKKGQSWVPIHPEEFLIHPQLLSTAENRAKSYLRREQNRNKAFRVDQNQTIEGQFTGKEGLVYLINLRKGEQLNLNLVSAPPDVFFRLSPDDGSGLDHRNWQGKVPHSGDVKITVFSVAEKPGSRFSLRLSRS